jgi:hypothetical protein
MAEETTVYDRPALYLTQHTPRAVLHIHKALYLGRRRFLESGPLHHELAAGIGKLLDRNKPFQCWSQVQGEQWR